MLACSLVLDWSGNVTKSVDEWFDMNRSWLTRFRGPLLVLLYENLKTDLGAEMKRIYQFLNVTVTADDLRCVIKNQEGDYHRPQHTNTGTISLYTPRVQDYIDSYVHRLEAMIKKRTGVNNIVITPAKHEYVI
jgi:hypothetical protein